MVEVKYPCYKERKDKSGYWYWIYYAKNGEEIARSSESYVAREDCTHSINLVKASTSDTVYFYE